MTGAARLIAAGLATAACVAAPPPALPGTALTGPPDANRSPSAAVPAAVVAPALLDHPDLLRFYAAAGWQPAWSVDSTALLAVLAAAADDGLRPDDYQVMSSDDVVTRDIAFTRMALRYARHLSLGRMRPESIDGAWIPSNDFDPVGAVLDAWASGTVARLPERLRPPHPEYDALRAHLHGPHASVVELNLERWRWLPRVLGPRHIVVDVPAFAARAVADDSVVWTSRIVVGRKEWPTPFLSTRVEQVVFAPSWTVPLRMVTEELLPAARADRAWLDRQGYTVFRGGIRLRSDTVAWSALPDSVAAGFRFVLPAGPSNPLGAIKLPLDNGLGILLHDTPDRAGFAAPARPFSHGCIRVERITALAAWLLGPDGWTADSVAGAVGPWAAGERRVPLTVPVPVYLTYFTAVVDDGGRLAIRPDIYEWDRRLAAALTAPPRAHIPRASGPAAAGGR
jgi:murein L,D-transpeptidase YcbB/YkuD